MSDTGLDMSLDGQTRRALASPTAAEVVCYQDRWLTWGEIGGVAEEVARLLNAAGVPERGVVGFVPRNRPSAIAAELGMVAQQRTVRMIHAFQSGVGIARDVDRLKLCAVVAAAEDFTPELLAVVQAQGLAAVALRELSAEVVAERCTAVADPAAPGEPQIQVHTSGTTGPPKNVGFSYDMIARYIVGENVSSVLGKADTTPPALLTFPLGNISGIYTLTGSLGWGLSSIFLLAPASLVLLFLAARRLSAAPPAGREAQAEALEASWSVCKAWHLRRPGRGRMHGWRCKNDWVR